MKGLYDEPQYSIDLLDGGTLLQHVVDNHISEQSLVMQLEHCGTCTCTQNVFTTPSTPQHSSETGFVFR